MYFLYLHIYAPQKSAKIIWHFWNWIAKRPNLMDKMTSVLGYGLLPTPRCRQILFSQTFGTHCTSAYQFILIRHGKSCKHASNACGQFFKNFLTFLDKQQFLCSFYPPMPTTLHYYPQLILFCMKVCDMMEKLSFLALLYA